MYWPSSCSSFLSHFFLGVEVAWRVYYVCIYRSIVMTIPHTPRKGCSIACTCTTTVHMHTTLRKPPDNRRVTATATSVVCRTACPICAQYILQLPRAEGHGGIESSHQIECQNKNKNKA